MRNVKICCCPNLNNAFAYILVRSSRCRCLFHSRCWGSLHFNWFLVLVTSGASCGKWMYMPAEKPSRGTVARNTLLFWPLLHHVEQQNAKLNKCLYGRAWNDINWGVLHIRAHVFGSSIGLTHSLVCKLWRLQDNGPSIYRDEIWLRLSALCTRKKKDYRT